MAGGLAAVAAVLALLASSALSHPTPGSSETLEARLPSTWYQRDDHFVHKLFRRDNSSSYPAVGSKEWLSDFSFNLPQTSQLPQEWFTALNNAVAANKIPNIPVATAHGSDNPTYSGKNPNSPEICSTTYGCQPDGVIYNAPDGVFASSFDDGPLPPTTKLVEFLSNNSEITTHFFIGSNIYSNPDQFLAAYNAGHDIAVHTWTHPFMTTLTNERVVAELGYTIEIIKNSTDGKIPKYWRPPYGDSDVRVVAIAKEVFGLTTIIWNNDTEDWMIPDGTNTVAKADASMKKWLTGSKSPGAIILEHELADTTVQVFMDSYPLIKQNGWNFTSLVRALGDGNPYQNSVDNSTSTSVAPSGSQISSGSGSPSATTSTTSTTPSSAAVATGPVSQALFFLILAIPFFA